MSSAFPCKSSCSSSRTQSALIGGMFHSPEAPVNAIRRFALCYCHCTSRKGKSPKARHHVPFTKFSGDLRNVAIVEHCMQPPIDIFDANRTGEEVYCAQQILHQLSLQGGQTKTGTCEAPRIWATGLSQTPPCTLSLDACAETALAQFIYT